MSNNLGLTAIGTRLIVRPVNKEKISKGGIIIPEKSQKKSSIGEVLQAGPECDTCKKGDVIMYEPLAGTEITAENEEKLLIMMEHSVMMIMKKAAS